MENQPDRLKEIEALHRGGTLIRRADIDWLIVELKRARKEAGTKDFETPTGSADRFVTIKSQLADLDAENRLSENSALRWLVDEVHRLRTFKNNVPADEICLAIQHTNPNDFDVAIAVRFIELWLKWVNNT